MGWGDDILRGLAGKPFYERERRRNPQLDAAIRAAGEETPEAGGNKYHARQTYVDGIRFDSKAEAERWQYLRLNERAGLISDLKRQVKIVFQTGVTWRIDFVYAESGRTVYEDVKGKITADYRIKRETIEWEIGTGARSGIYREVRKHGRGWDVTEYGKED